MTTPDPGSELDRSIERIHELLAENQPAHDQVRLERDLVIAMTAKLLVIETRLLTETADRIATTLARLAEHYHRALPDNVTPITPTCFAEPCLSPADCRHTGCIKALMRRGDSSSTTTGGSAT